MNNKLLIIICNLVLLSSCSQNDCCDVVSVLKLSDSLYDETYRTYCGGVYGGDVCRTYITDSISFRKYIGKYAYMSCLYYLCLIFSNLSFSFCICLLCIAI